MILRIWGSRGVDCTNWRLSACETV